MDSIDRIKALKALLLLNVFLLAAHLCFNHFFATWSWTVSRWFDLDAEANIPTWFSSTQFLLLFFTAIICRRQCRDKELSRFYLLVALTFLFFSVDEAAKIHEGITIVFKNISVRSFFPDSHGLWILVYPVVLLGLLLRYYKGFIAFLLHKPGRNIFILGAGIFVTGGIGFEALGYYLNNGKSSLFYLIEVTAEEGFELLGQSLMIFALLTKSQLLSSQRHEKTAPFPKGTCA